MPAPQKQGFDLDLDLDDQHRHHAARGDAVGSWGFSSNINFTRMSQEENNVWFFEQVFNFLRSFFGVVMPDSIEITTVNATQQINRGNLDQMTFLDELMLILKNLKERIWTLKLKLSVVGFLRSDWNPDNPIRVRIQEPASFTVWGGPDESGFQTFTISATLFSTRPMINAGGVELWSVNQPLLEKALKKWERQTGRRIDVVRGNSPDMSLGRHGFQRPAPHNLRPTPPPEPEDTGPVEDFIPDLEDLNF
ncbi:MAG: hypothetical protein COV45_00495 [Deltaproteobacteria bacterium CG11_big_fil_rev_8_21_14_0_20_47_16]|nr:MAG: hypothetical protein COV45_00495 [Deltaproteobacteria bacterium CG11_big_fil_rev_8_21_14_0_20_47_16]